MFAPVVLPVEVTFFVMLVLLIGLPLGLRRFTQYPILASFGICAVLSVPILLVVGSIVDAIRYGEFYHADATRLNDGYVELPADATEITLHKYASGHEMKFKTTKESLESWMTELTKQRRKYSDATPFKLDLPSDSEAQESKHRFGQHGWRYPDDAVIYRGWRPGRGGGFDVWYSEKEQSAFIHGLYW